MKKTAVQRQFSIVEFCSAFSFSWDEHFVFHGESHNFWEIVFITGGKVEATEDEKIYTLSENDMLLHAPLEFHRIRSADNTHPEGMTISFRTVGTLPVELRKGIFALGATERQEYELIFEKIRQLMAEQTENPYAGQEAADLLSAFLIRLGGEAAMRKIAVSATAAEYRKVVLAMTEHVCENLTLADFAAICNISVSYVKLLFKKYAGISPKAYYANLRIRHATALLLDGTPAIDIADQMNFSSPNYFSVFFKKHLGISPMEYKKSMEKDAAQM